MAVNGLALAIFLGSGTAAVLALVSHLQLDDGSPWRAPAALTLLGLALVQLRIGWPFINLADRIQSPSAAGIRDFLIVVALAYSATLVAGPVAGRGYLFLTLACACYTAGLARLRWPRTSLFDGKILPHPISQAGMTCVFGLLLSGAVVEVGLRIYGGLSGDHLPIATAVRDRQWPSGSTVRGGRVNALGYWGDDFVRTSRPNTFRVAVLGDESALSGTATTNCFRRLEHSLLGVEVYNFAVPQTGPREYSALLRGQVLDYRPDLVLVLVSIGNDITEQLAEPGCFDARGLRLYQLAAASSLLPSMRDEGIETAVGGRTSSEFLSQAERQLIVCRTPLDEALRGKWQVACDHFDSLIEQARKNDVEVAFVAVPASYQVNAALCRQLQKRLGYTSTDVDLELPQRRLSAFAASRQVAWIDLLPVLRETEAAPFEPLSLELSASGNQTVAETLEHWIASHFRQLVSPVAQASTR